MTWRDYAQGAYRMRGIGKGQTIRMLVIPEIKELVRAAKNLCGQGDVTDDTFVTDAAAWLYLNGMKSEQMQSIVLSKQDVQNLARKTALRNVMGAVETGHLDRYARNQLTKHCIEYFEEAVSLSPADTIDAPKSFAEHLQSLADAGRRMQLIDGGSDWAAVQEIIRRLQDASGEAAQGLDGMMEQEQEQEEQKQKEQEQELEIIILPQHDEGRRDPLRWDIRLLQQHTPTPETLGFSYPLADFETPRKFSQEERRAMRDHAAALGVMMTDAEIDLTLARQSGSVKLGFPPSTLVTHNFCDAKETAGRRRSLRHACAVLHWSSGGDSPGTRVSAIALTLAEAETIRCAIQQRHRVIAKSQLQISLVSSSSVVASTEAAREAAPQLVPQPGSEAVRERPLGSERDQVCLVFFNGDRDNLTRSHGKTLMECLQGSTRHERLSWWESVCDMRRSTHQGGWRSVPSLLSLFSLDSTEQLSKIELLRKAVADTMDEAGLTVIDVDLNNDGCIQLDELVEFISRLFGRNAAALQPSRLDIEALVRDADASNDGVLQYDEFRACARTLYLTGYRSGVVQPFWCNRSDFF